MICEAIGLDYEHRDKVDHLAGGALIGAVSSLVVEDLWPDMHPAKRAVVALIPVVVVAVAKEVIDHQDPDHHSSEWQDAAATVVGGTIAVGICLRW